MKRCIIVMLCVISIAAHASINESFDGAGTSIENTDFSTRLWPSLSGAKYNYRRGSLPEGLGAGNPLLPVSANSDKVLYLYDYSLAENRSETVYSDVIMDGYIGADVADSQYGWGNAEFHLRASDSRSSYSIGLYNRGDTSAVFSLRVRRDGLIAASFPGSVSEQFDVDLDNENYHVRASAIGNEIMGEIWRVTVENNQLVETPIDLLSAPGIQNQLVLYNSEFSSGYVSLDGRSGGLDGCGSMLGFDDITVIPEPATLSLIGLLVGGFVFIRRLFQH